MKQTSKVLLLIVICGLFVLCVFVQWQLALTVGLIMVGSLGYLERVTNVAISRNVRISLLVLFVVFSTGQAIYSHFKEGNLNDKLKQAEDSTAKAKGQIQALVGSERELRERTRLAEDAAIKATQDADLLRYQDIALYNAIGNKSGKLNDMPFVSTPINDWSQRFVTRREGVIEFACSSDAIDACRSVIKKVPLYPFSYYFLAKCLKERQDPLWREHALTAGQIFSKTVVLPGHHGDHDLAIKEVTGILKK
jgi:hypothetical protein